MAMSGFICHDDYYDRLQRLSDEEVGHLFRQLMLYHSGRTDEMTDFIGVEGIAFDFISNDIDRTEEKHSATSETNRVNGTKGGRPKKQQEPEETEQNPTEPTETEQNRQKPTETEQNPTKPYKDKDKDIYKDKKEKEKEREDLFNRFWSAYPRHENKQTARKAFDRLNPDDALLTTMLKAISRQKGSAQWQEKNGQFIPHPATWLNGRRWEDETKPSGGFEQRDYSNVQDEYTDILAEEIAEFKKGAG